MTAGDVPQAVVAQPQGERGLATLFAEQVEMLGTDALDFASRTPEELSSVVTYQLRGVMRSKFFRPLLTWAAGTSHGVRRDVLRYGALAVHLIHESSLI